MEDRRTREALEALADLYLTEPVEVDSDSPDPRQKRSSRQNGPGGPIRVEAVLIGHLPGASGSWASQYAEHVAEQRGPAVMLHFEQGGLIVDVYRIDQAADNNYKFPTGAAAESAEPEPSPADDDLPPGASLTELLEHLAAGGDLATWLVRPPQPTGEIGRRIVQAIDRWTLISGCDDAAVVAGYRLLKGLRTHDESDRRVGLMIMGAEGPPAELAAAKLRRTLDEFLETPAEAVGYRPRMTPLHRRTLAEFEGDVVALWQEAAAWMAGRGVEPPAEPAEQEPTTDQQPPAPETGPTAGESPRPTPAFGPEPHWRESADRLDREISEDFQPTMTAAEARSHAHEAGDSEAPAAPPQAESEPEPEMAAGAASEAPPEPAPALPSLADHLPHLTALAARRPRHDGIELAVDDAGRLHLFTDATDRDPHEALVELLATGRWAEEHHALLALTVPDREVGAAAPELHVFTDTPKPLAAHAGDPAAPLFRLHLLRPGDPPVHVELN